MTELMRVTPLGGARGGVPARPWSGEPGSLVAPQVDGPSGGVHAGASQAGGARPAGRSPGSGSDGGSTDAGPAPPLQRLLNAVRTRRGRTVVVAAVALVAVGAVAAVIVSMSGGATPGALPAVVIQQTSAASPAPATPDPTPEPDASNPKAVAFLAALRREGVPVSVSGQSETEAADALCQQVAGGVDKTTLAQEMPALLPGVPPARADDVVAAASKFYC